METVSRDYARFIATVLGRAGSGKTTLIRELVFSCAPRPVFIIDTMDEYDIGLQFEDTKHLAEYIASGAPNATGIYTINVTDDSDADLFFELMVRLREPMTIVVDEASKFCNPHVIDERLKKLISYGRHWKANLIMSARRPTELHRDVTAQSDFIVSFRQDEPRDIQQLKQAYSEAEKLPTLAMPGDYLVFGDYERTPLAACLNCE